MLAKKPLTERTVQSLKATGQRYMHYDALVPGLAVRVMENGYKSFVLVARFPGSTNPTARAIATVGKITLEDARSKAREWHKAIRDGVDPAAARADTFKAVVEEYLAREGDKLRTADQRRAQFERLYPLLGSRPVGDIRRQEIVRLLDRIEDERGPEAAHRSLALISKVFNWHASRSEFRSPLVRGMGRTQHNSRQRVLSDEELRSVWLACEGTTFGSLIRFLLLTSTRRTEAAAMQWSELANGDWIIPQVRYKTGLELVVPLSAAAKSVLDAMPRIGEFVFTTDGRRPIGGFAKHKARLDRASGVSGWVLHDTRRTARSLMSRAGINADVAERMLGHVIGGVRSVYDRHSFYEEKKLGYEKLANLIDQLVNPRENVVPLASVTRM
jgi:integrase